MLMQEPTEEMIKEWKEIYEQNKEKIKPNKKDSMDIIKFLENNYPITRINNKKIENIIYDNIMNNEFSANKLKGEAPNIRVFIVENEGNGSQLYSKQDNVFKGIQIIVGIELKTSYIFVEGSSYLYDELFAFSGLDEIDVENYFLVAQYMKCKEKFNV